MHHAFKKIKDSYFNNFRYDNFNFKYGRDENYCVDLMSYIIYNSVKCLNVMLRQFMFMLVKAS